MSLLSRRRDAADEGQAGDAFAEFDQQSIALLRHTSIIGYRAALDAARQQCIQS
jgi:hypothetical protein